MSKLRAMRAGLCAPNSIICCCSPTDPSPPLPCYCCSLTLPFLSSYLLLLSLSTPLLSPAGPPREALVFVLGRRCPAPLPALKAGVKVVVVRVQVLEDPGQHRVGSSLCERARECVCMCVCVFVYVCEREGENEREGHDAAACNAYSAEARCQG
jgi:hypothetical protein